MKIGIIGTGNMGRAIGVRLAQVGHQVLFGAREPRQAEAAAKRAGHMALSGTNDDAARYGEALIWTIRDSDPAAVLTGPSALDGKIIVNINNRDYARDVQGGAWFAEAIAEALQANAPKTRVVKALNLVAMEALDISPDKLRAAGAQLFIAGDDAASKATVSKILDELGFEAIDMGAGAVATRAVEALADVLRLLIIGEHATLW